MARVFLSVGSNLGDRLDCLRRAVEQLRAFALTDGACDGPRQRNVVFLPHQAQAFADARDDKVSSVVVSDRAAVEACLRFADDQRTLVEPACGAALAVLYGRHAALAQARYIAVIVCGGIGVTHAKLTDWQRILRQE